jgi:hypothetical protein
MNDTIFLLTSNPEKSKLSSLIVNSGIITLLIPGYINVSYTSKNVRANPGLMAGTYAHYNISSEPPSLRNLWQANVGLKLSRNKC